MKQEIPRFLATTNKGKVEEWNSILAQLGPDAMKIQPIDKKLELIEIQDLDPARVALTKAVDAWYQDGRELLVEDVSFAIPEWQGFPGALYKFVNDGIGNDGLLKLVADKTDRSAVVTITIAYVVPGNFDSRQGSEELTTQINVVRVDVRGKIPTEARGDNGFGFDSIFIPDGEALTYAQMTTEQKNACSMRRMVIQKLMQGGWVTYPITDSPLKRYLS